MSSTNANNSNPFEADSENNAAIVASPANAKGDGNAPQANVLARKDLAENGQSSIVKAPKSLHPSMGGPPLRTDNSGGEVATVTTANTSKSSDDLETGKTGALVNAAAVYPIATTVASFPHPEEHTRTANDRVVASILNEDNMNEVKLVPGKILKEDDEDDSLGKMPVKEQTSRGYFVHDTRRGAALLTLVFATIALIIILSVTIPYTKSQQPAPSSALDGSTSTGVTTPTEDNQVPVPSPTKPPPTTERWSVLRDIIVLYGVTPEEILDDPTTPQHKALNWLANVDPGSSWSVAEDERVVQRYVLATLYYALEGESWTETYNWLSEKHECDDWHSHEYDGFFDFTPDTYGIVCKNEGFLGMESGETVTEIRLDSNKLMGEIPRELEALTSLEVIFLSDNDIMGSLSPDVLAMPNLKVLGLQNNKIFGKIPANVGVSMTYLDLSSNELSGEIPDALWNASLLSTLSLGDNPLLTGTISDTIGEMINLQTLNLENLNLVGTIPESIRDLTALQVFKASKNALSGAIPDVFDSLPIISELDLSDNKLTGSIPDSLASVPHPMLNSINLQKNRLSGELPAGLAMNVFLTFLGLSDNEFEGSVPWTWGTFMLLNTLTLSNNQLTGDIESLCYVSKLTADCLGDSPEVECSCCAQCCDADGLCDPDFVSFGK